MPASNCVSRTLGYGTAGSRGERLRRWVAAVLACSVVTVAHSQGVEQQAAQTQQDAINDAENCRLGLASCSSGPGAAPGNRIGPDPCFLQQNAMRPCNSEQRQSVNAPGIDSKLAGTWEVAMPHGRWVLQIFRNGTYQFHSEAADNAPAHAGTFSARDGQWSLSATSGYTDGGTYTLQSSDTWIATGRLGTGTWHRQSRENEPKEAAQAPPPAKR